MNRINHPATRQWLLALACSLAAGAAQAEAPPQVVPVLLQPVAATVDGDLREWGRDGWLRIPIKPALENRDRAKYGLDGEGHNHTGSIAVLMKAGVAQGRLFIAVRWPDETPDTDYKGWEWSGTKYMESKKHDDMFAVRFHLDGEFDRSMLSGKTYRADVWLWSAARSNPAGYAEDMLHIVSAKPIDNAAEYETAEFGTLYIKKIRDTGTPVYKMTRPPKSKEAERLPSFELVAGTTGSVADVAAKGIWKEGYWNLELARKLDTGHADDAVFQPGKKLLGQIAVFNHSGDENKSISEPLLFDFSAVK